MRGLMKLIEEAKYWLALKQHAKRLATIGSLMEAERARQETTGAVSRCLCAPGAARMTMDVKPCVGPAVRSTYKAM